MGRLQTPQNYVVASNHITGESTEFPCFTCSNCQRVVIMHPNRKRPRNQCGSCDRLHCDYCPTSACSVIQRDAERAFEDKWKQPWMLRDGGEPVRRILDQHGNPILVKAKDVSYTDRELANIGGELNYDGSAKRKAGEGVL